MYEFMAKTYKLQVSMRKEIAWGWIANDLDKLLDVGVGGRTNHSSKSQEEGTRETTEMT